MEVKKTKIEGETPTPEGLKEEEVEFIPRPFSNRQPYQWQQIAEGEFINGASGEKFKGTIDEFNQCLRLPSKV